MARIDLDDCLRVLDLPPSATPTEIRQRFRSLVRELHPDVRRSDAERDRFVALVRAYHTLREALRLDAHGQAHALCPRCGRFDELFTAADGTHGCAPCLLGETRRHRLLPLPIVVMVRHLPVAALYVAGGVLGVLYGRTTRPEFAVASLACILGGALLLVGQVLWLSRRGTLVTHRRLRRWTAS